MIRPVFQFYLRGYRKSGAATYQKAWIQLTLLLVSALVIPFFILNNYLALGRLDPGLTIFLGAGFIIIAALSFVLRSGRFQLSGHLFLALIFFLIWREMFLGFASTPLNRLDTIVLLLAGLLMAPLMTDKVGLLVHFAANLAVLSLFILENPAAAELGPGELDAYATDAYLSMCVTAIVAYLLTRTAERGRRRIEITNANLEEKTRLHTNALSLAADDLKGSRDIMHRDILMARNVQRSVLFRDPPLVDDWDIAHFYRPMAQVSGDFYDFHADGNRLDGVGLFDVSGHGIASGLITMLSRSIIQRCFNAPDAPSLGEIMEQANEDLISNLRGSVNFISGVLLRFQGDSMEYANAGHPGVLLKPAGRDAESLPDNDEPGRRGSLLGVEFLRGDYPIIRRDISPGDSLLLFSDGVIEAERHETESFGLSRLVESLNKSNGSAHDRLQSIVMEHTRFMEYQPSQDDVTMILLVKKDTKQ